MTLIPFKSFIGYMNEETLLTLLNSISDNKNYINLFNL